MPITPHQLSHSTKSRNPIHRDDPLHYVTNIGIDILHGEDQETIGIAKVFEVMMDQIDDCRGEIFFARKLLQAPVANCKELKP
jgi:hypothetical protein